MNRQTIGFNWRPSVVSTPLQDILLAVGIMENNMAGKHIAFTGHKDLINKVGLKPLKDEQCGELVEYGVSMSLAHVMHPACCV